MKILRDDDNQNITLFHGTYDTFEISEFYDNPTWFSVDKDIAGTFGDNVIEVNITYNKMLDLTDSSKHDTLAKEIFKKEIEENFLGMNEYFEEYPALKHWHYHSPKLVESAKHLMQKNEFSIFSEYLEKFLLYKSFSIYAIYQNWDNVIDYAKKNKFDCIKNNEEAFSSKYGLGTKEGFVVLGSKQIHEVGYSISKTLKKNKSNKQTLNN